MLALVVPSFSSAALNYADVGSVVTINASTQITNLNESTILMWIRPTTLTNSRVLMRKGTLAATGWSWIIQGTIGNTRNIVGYDTVNQNLQTTDTPIANLTQWKFCALTWNITAAVRSHQYCGNATTIVTEDTYTSVTNGSSGRQSDTGLAIGIGNIPGGTSAWQGDIASIQYVQREMTLGEIRGWQFQQYKVANSLGYYQLGWNGNNSQTDYSGNNIGTLYASLTTTVAHVPINTRSRR